MLTQNTCAVGTETAAEIKNRYPSKEVTLVHSRQELMSSESLLPSEYKNKVLEPLRSNGVNVILGKHIVDGTNDDNPSRVTLETGHPSQQMLSSRPYLQQNQRPFSSPSPF